MKSIILCSGGLDSVTLAYYLASRGDQITLLSFDYGQRHRRELLCAKTAATRLGAESLIVDISAMRGLFGGSALTDDVSVPEGHYTASNMASTVVPNRNAVLLALAYALAVVKKADVVALAVHAGDHAIYPDCRPEFLTAFETMQRFAVQGYGQPGLHLEAPFIARSKGEIVTIGARLGVPFGETWSCYNGRLRHCGRCGTCIERKEAFVSSGIADPTEYE